MRHLLIRSCALGLLLPAVLLAGKLTLKDGTVLEGTIKKYGTSYNIKLKDGTSKMVLASDVASVDDPALAPPANTTGGTASNAGPTAGAAGNSSEAFTRTQRAAERVTSPLIAVTLWQDYIDKATKPEDKAAGTKERDRWQQMAKEGAERIKGKWVTGDELKKLHDQVDGMLKDAREMLGGDQAIKGVKKIEEVLKIYPNSFEANFEMGYFYLRRITRIEGSNAEIDKSITCLETANKLKPNSPATLSNLAIAYNFRKRYEDSVLSAYKAAQLDDSQEIVQNLFNSLTQAPPGMRKNNPKVAPIVADAMLLAGKRGVAAEGKWLYVRPRMTDPKGGNDDGPGGLARRGIVGSGTGFFISDDGYIMTNRHVAAGGDKLIVRLSDGTQKVAEKVVVDDEQDIAILKLKNDPAAPFPFIRIADYETPEVGTDVTVMGFPLGAMFGTNVKITRGVVTSIENDRKSPCDVIVDAQVNPGNSGGPMLDKHGNLLALVAMKTLSDEAVSSYGLGISTSRLRKFFEHQKDKVKPIKLAKADKVDETTTPLSTEQIAKKFTKATVMILIVSGDLPEGLK